MENKTENNENNEKKVNFQFEYIRNIYSDNPMVGQELFRLNFPVQKKIMEKSKARNER